MLDTIIRYIILACMAIWCFVIIRPFLPLLLWGAIIAVVAFPFFLWLSQKLGGRRVLASVLIAVLGVGIIIGPVGIIVSEIIKSFNTIATNIADSSFQISPPPEQVSNIPVFGSIISEVWQQASVNLSTVLNEYRNQLQALTGTLLSVAGSTGISLAKFLLSTIISAALMLNAEPLSQWVTRLILRLDPNKGKNFVSLAVLTVRNVTRGVIGISLFQTFLVAIGLIVGKIPLAGILIVACLVLSIIQIGPAIIILPVIIYAWLQMGILQALAFTIWMIASAASDNVLKPMLMARGLPVPMLVIFIGVLGGTFAHGIIGLFIGPVILALGYELLQAWLNEDGEGELVMQ